jgi:DNA-binding NtrC family response regulator
VVAGFTDPQECLRYIQAHDDILAVISDYRMPGMLGSSLLAQIQKVHPDLPCVIITAHATPDTIVRLAKSARLVRLLPKPWDRDLLLQILESLQAEYLDPLEQHGA